MRRTKIDVENARQMYESGMTLKEVGDELGFSAGAIFRQFKNHGIERRPKGGWNRSIYAPKKIDFDCAVTLYQHGMTLQQIGDVFNCSKQAVHKLLRYHGVEREEGRQGPKPRKPLDLPPDHG